MAVLHSKGPCQADRSNWGGVASLCCASATPVRAATQHYNSRRTPSPNATRLLDSLDTRLLSCLTTLLEYLDLRGTLLRMSGESL